MCARINRQPIWRIFQLSLVPRLDRIPTRAQRNAEAESAARKLRDGADAR